MATASGANISVRLSRALTEYWTGPPSVDVHGSTLAEALGDLDARVPGISARILDDQGRIRQHVAVFLNQEYLRHPDPAAVSLREGDRIHIVPSVSGG
jgi:molybdopterin converting factor small subunit